MEEYVCFICEKFRFVIEVIVGMEVCWLVVDVVVEWDMMGNVVNKVSLIIYGFEFFRLYRWCE